MCAHTCAGLEDITPNSFQHLDEHPLLETKAGDHLNVSSDHLLRPPDDTETALSISKNDLGLAEINLLAIVRGCETEDLLESEIKALEDRIERIRTRQAHYCHDLYYKATSMVRVQRNRLNRENPRLCPHDFRMQRPYSSRLPTPLEAKSYAKEDLLEQDKAPFTIRRPDNQREFLHTLRDPLNDEHRLLEQSAYDATLRDPAEIISKPLRLTSLRALAAERGIRRAALQLALRSFATNEEQRYSGESVYRCVPLPKPKQTLQNPALPTAETLYLHESDPFAYTQSAVKLQTEQGWLAQLVESEERVQDNLPSICGIGLASGAQLQRGSVLRGKLESLGRQLMAIGWTLVYEVSEQDITHHISMEMGVAGLAVIPKMLKNKPTKEHLIKIAEAWQAGFDSILRPGTRNQDMEVLLRDHQDIVNIPLSESERIALRALATAPPPPSISTIRITHNHSLMGFRAGRQFAQIRSHLNAKIFEKKIREYNRAVRAGFNRTREGVAELFPRFATAHFQTSKDIAKPLTAGLPMPLNEREVVGLVRAQVVRENSEDKRHKKLDLTQLWSFADRLPPTRRDKVYFSMERWPPKPDAEAPSRRSPKNVNVYGAVGYRDLRASHNKPTFRLPPEEVGISLVPEASREVAGHRADSTTRSNSTAGTRFTACSLGRALAKADTEITCPSTICIPEKRGPPDHLLGKPGKGPKPTTPFPYTEKWLEGNEVG
ncbi:hypothetical protein FGG08_002543 [Glutinoglossum americanum]|uniref:Uncharacterized protein n=1 Tax=Glutinoglossum americanum TaxID=1670608 RepID=A0A9P8L1J9_9PEZI|nr:hypothetical protein FGG08_002543 [Glutinoglossum americanum]